MKSPTTVTAVFPLAIVYVTVQRLSSSSLVIKVFTLLLLTTLPEPAVDERVIISVEAAVSVYVTHPPSSVITTSL